jgi:plastocyanin
VLLALSGRASADEARPPAVNVSRVHGTGAVTGRITYQRDPARPWRLGRYYLRNGRDGALAEAVVAVSRPGLRVPADSRGPVTVTVDQKDFQFTPETVAIRVDDRVRFLNSDPQTHNVQTFHASQSFNVTIPAGAEHVEIFPAAGGIPRPYRIGCAFHGAMRAWVFVFDHPWFQVTGKDGAFALRNVPPGEYRLDVVHPAGELHARRTITVKADSTLELDIALTPDNLAKSPGQTPPQPAPGAH